jgi:hypothetical protein
VFASQIATTVPLDRVIDQWNLRHGEARGFWVKIQHWSTDCHPAIGERTQAGGPGREDCFDRSGTSVNDDKGSGRFWRG